MTNKEAIEILKELPDRIVSMLMPLDIDFDYKEAITIAIKALEEIPQGEWELLRVAEGMKMYDVYVCPFCNFEHKHIKSNFCENCGAEMYRKDKSVQEK